MINICIVEDEKKHYEVLKKYIEKCVGENNSEYHVDWVMDGLDILENYKSQYDIIFLDIQLKHLNGMEAAEKIRLLDEEVEIIFITSTVQYAVQGYAVDALGYVLKPVPYVAFEKIFNKAITKVKAKQQKFFVRVTVDDKQLKINCDSIFYIESQRNNVLIHCQDGNYITIGPLKKFEELLGDKGFCKCHNAYLVNLSKVEAVLKAEISLTSGDILPLSRARKKEFMMELTNDI